jgi:hypothetical protein
MIGRPAKSFLLILLFMLAGLNAQGQNDRTTRVRDLYRCLNDYGIECPKTVLAVAIFETGWMECKHCAYQYNNLFGFRTNINYIRFGSIYECLDYLKVWQATYYDPWKTRHPNGSYYQYLVHIKYARGTMVSYISTIKAIEKLVDEDVKEIDASPFITPGIGTEGR